MNWERVLVAIIIGGVIAIIALSIGDQWAGAITGISDQIESVMP